MSIIDTLNHSVVSYDPKSSKAFAGQRLSKVSYKTVSDKESALYGIKRESKCVSLPVIEVAEVIGNVSALAPAICEYLQTVQDKIVREKVDAGAASISMNDVGIVGILEWLDSQNGESGRLTKEVVGNWFSENIEESLAVLLAEKLGVSEIPTDEESKQIMAVVAGFKDKVSSLAGGKTSYEPKLAESLKKCLNLAPDGDILKCKFMNRLDKMIAESKKGIDLIDLL